MDDAHAIMHGMNELHGPPGASLRWDDLAVLLAVLRAGSFTAASEMLGVEQSTVSRRIAALERALGASLFDRLATGPRATELGERLRAHAERIEAEVHGLVDHARGEQREIRGRVRVALTESLAVQVVIPHLLGELRALHPQLDVDLVTSDLSADLGRREADVALRFYRPETGDLVAKRVATMRTAVLAHRSYPKRRSRSLASHDWVALSLPGVRTADEALLESCGIEPRMRTNSHLAQVEAVRAGLGVALLTRSLLKLDPGLVVLPLELPALPSVELWLVTPRPLRTIPRIDAVVRFFERKLVVLES